MKIKSILASVAAAGVLATASVAGFAAAEDDIMLISDTADGAGLSVGSVIESIFGSDFIGQLTGMLAGAIEEAGGVDAFVAPIVEQMTPVIEQLKDPSFVEAIKAIAEEQGADLGDVDLAEITAAIDAIDLDEIVNGLTAVCENVALGESITVAIDLNLPLTEEDGAFLESLIPTLEQNADAIKGLVEMFAGQGGVIVGPGGENPDGGDGAAQGGADNPDTGAEGVAAVVGLLTIAGATVVISRKKS